MNRAAEALAERLAQAGRSDVQQDQAAAGPQAGAGPQDGARRAEWLRAAMAKAARKKTWSMRTSKKSKTVAIDGAARAAPFFSTLPMASPLTLA